MGPNPFQTEALTDFCSEGHLKLLDAIDSLRSQGISKYVSLPQIVVCGDQSSGKSSVLEAISGVPFPVKSNLCTRFPTELVLRNTSHAHVRVSIVPQQSYSKSEQSSLEGFQKNLDGFERLPDLIESAKGVILGSTSGRAFSKDLLKIEVSGPNLPHLTIVDLPGLIHSETKQQSSSDVRLVKEVVRKYMKEPRSIILAVVSAMNDINNQIVLRLARNADPKGTRTLGVITKPDTLKAGSKREDPFVALAKNQEVVFKHGWHVLKNMDSEDGRYTLGVRDAEEEKFFSEGKWKDLTTSQLGINKLRERLSRVLLWHIGAELPSLISEIELKSSTCRNRMKLLGEPRSTFNEQRHYLIQISQSFQALAKAAIDGTYNDLFFKSPMSEDEYHKRIRALIQNLNEKFSEEMTERGHRRRIDSFSHSTLDSGSQISVTRTEYLNHIQPLIQRTKGRELPGMFNPMVVTDLFREQSSPWETITQEHVEKVWRAARKFLRLILTHVTDAGTSRALFSKVFEPSLDELFCGLKEKTRELLKPHQAGHPITYNQEFTKALEKLRNERAKDEITEAIQHCFGVESLESVGIGNRQDLRLLSAVLSQRTALDVKVSACSEALDCMQAYYEVALKRFIDDVASQIVEDQLVSKLYDIFSPIYVISMPIDLVNAVAGESGESRAEREQLIKQLDILTKGYDICTRFKVIQGLDAHDDTIQSSQQSQDSEYDSFESDTKSDGSEISNLGEDHDLTSMEALPAEVEPPAEPEQLAEPEVSVEPEADFTSPRSNSKKSKKAKKRTSWS